MKKAAKSVGVKSVEMIKSKELLQLTGYIHGGCSPIGMKKQFKTVIDKTIIDQKYQFIQSADERKERQIKIAQEAKNDSQDKQEVEKRRELELVMLYNTFLRHKMDEQLKANEKIEKTFQEIRDICVSYII